MKTWIGLIISDERLARTVQTLLKVNSAAQVVGTYTDAKEAARDLKDKGDVLVIFGIGPDRREFLKNLRVIQLSGPYPVLGVGTAADASPLLFDAFRLGMLDFISLPPEEIENPTDSLLKEIMESIDALSAGSSDRIRRVALKPFKETEKVSPSDQASYYVAVGVPRGGVSSAVRLLSQFPRRRDTALVVSLPIPQQSVAPFIADLKPYTQWSVHPALTDGKIQGGGCYLFSTQAQYTVEGSIDGKCRIVTRAEGASPIDSIMENLAGSFGGSVVGLLLEGTGKDGVGGLSAVKSRGGTTLTIKAGGGVLGGRPSAASAKESADLLVDGDELAKALTSFMGEMQDITNINRILNYQ